MNVKKLILSLFAVLALSVLISSAKEKVIIPDYDLIVDNSLIYYKDSLYPFISYRDVTYFPMTYDYCRALKISSSYSEDEGLFLAYTPGRWSDLPIYGTVNNQKTDYALFPTYNIYVNGRLIDNENEPYPFLSFRGVTYCPMTWDFAVNEFNWALSWTDGRLLIETDANYNSTFELIKKDDKGAVVCQWVTKEIPLGDGVFKQEPLLIYSYLDFSSGEFLVLSDYSEPGERPSLIKYSESDGLVFDREKKEASYKGFPLSEIKSIKETDMSGCRDVYYDVTGYELSLNGVKFLKTNEYFNATMPDGSGQGFSTSYLYLLDGDNPVFLGNSLNIENAAILGEDVYFSVSGYIQTVFSHPLSQKLLYRYKGGVLNLINSEFPDYGSVSLIGEAGGLLYLKCEWCPESRLESLHEISPVNDGYFTFDGERLLKISPWFYSDIDLLTPSGDIYAFINMNGKIKKISANGSK